MRKEVFCLYERDLMKTVGGQLFDQAPNREPRKAEVIMRKLRDSFREKAYNDNEQYSWNIPAEELYKTVEKLLKDIPEFRDLNLSQIEFVELLKENQIQFFFNDFVGNWDSLVSLIEYGVSDIYIVNELGFDLKEVAEACKENNVKIKNIITFFMLPLFLTIYEYNTF